MKRYQTVLRTIAHIIFVIVFGMAIMAIIRDNKSNEAPIGSFDTIEYNEGWSLIKNGIEEKISLPYVGEGFYKKHVVLKNVLPDSIKDGMQLCCRTDLADIKVYVGGELRANYGEDTVGYVGFYPPSAYEFVAINQADAGKEIRLEIYTKKKTGKFDAVSIGYGNNGWFDIIHNNIVEMSVAIFMIFIGFIAIVFYFLVRRKINANRSIMFLGQTIMMLGMWIVSESKLRQLVFKMPSLTQIICYMSLEVLSIYVLLYYDEIQGHKYHKFYIMLETFNLGQLLINLGFAYTGIIELHDTLRLSHIWIILSLPAVISFMIRDCVSKRVRNYRISAIGMFVFIISTSCEIISYYVSNSHNLGTFLGIGLVVLLGATISQTLFDAYNTERKSREHVEKSTIATIETIANAIDARDEYTGGHSARVAEYAAMLAEKIAPNYNFSDKDVKRIHYIALMHDIGKIGIPDAVLNKPGRLTDEEFAIMKQHAVIGDRLLKDIDTVEGLADGVRHHHERYDGKGYPDGLSGEDIPVVARILCIADCFDAMTSNRVYRKRLSDEQVRAELERCSGSQFDPQMLEAFCELLDSGELNVK